MTIRLRITGPGGLAVPFESSATAVHIGRDPACELVLEGEISSGVSRQHARIDRTAGGGATVVQLSETNATLLNDKPLAGAATVMAGDRIQLGYTGPVVEVVSIAKLPPPPALVRPAPAKKSMLPVIIGGASVLGVLVGGVILTFVFVLNRGNRATTTTTPTETAVASTSRPAPPTTTVAATPTTAATPPVAAPPAVPVVVGRSIPHPERLPSLLMQQLGDLYPWVSLGPYDRVRTGQPLLALPGYRAAVELDSKVQLTLSANLPEFDPTSAVLETVVTLNPPAGGFDADVVLDRGRIRVANRKPDGPARVRLQFGTQKWDVVLPSPTSQVGLEWAIDPARVLTAGKQTLARYQLRLIAVGGVKLMANGTEVKLPEPQAELVWAEGQAPSPRPLGQLPAWWADRPDPAALSKEQKEVVQEAWVGLADWAEWLARVESPVYTVRGKIREEKDNPMARRLGLFFLPALDAPRDLIDLLEDPQLDSGPFQELHDAGFRALQLWVNRDSQHPDTLARDLRTAKQYPAEAAQEVANLLQWRPESELRDPVRAGRVAHLLGSDSLAVRTLAHMQLSWVVPREVREKHNYDPAGKPADRAKAAAEWQAAVARLKR